MADTSRATEFIAVCGALLAVGCGGAGLEHRAWAPKGYTNVKPFSCTRSNGATHCDAVVSPSSGGALEMISVVYFDQPDEIPLLHEVFRGASSAAARARGTHETALAHTVAFEHESVHEKLPSVCYVTAGTRCVVTVNPETAVVVQVGAQPSGDLVLGDISVTALSAEADAVEGLFQLGALKIRGASAAR